MSTYHWIDLSNLVEIQVIPIDTSNEIIKVELS